VNKRFSSIEIREKSLINNKTFITKISIKVTRIFHRIIAILKKYDLLKYDLKIISHERSPSKELAKILITLDANIFGPFFNVKIRINIVIIAQFT